MIAFDYRTPGSLEEAYADLKELGSDGKLIAGGTALVIMMKQQLLQPSCVISLRNVAGLSDVSENNGSVHIGGLVSHAALDASAVVQGKLSMLGATYHHVATQRVRTMATVGGGLAHADPNQDPPPSFIALGASFELGSAAGTRTVAAEDFSATTMRPCWSRTRSSPA
jgi:carbon-monoxide dehydrogenase medium subunit